MSRSKWNSISRLPPSFAVPRRSSSPEQKLGFIVLAGVSTVLALGSTSVKMPALGSPPEQHQEMDCDALNAERTRLLSVKGDLNNPRLSSKTEAERAAELTQRNRKLYAIAKEAETTNVCYLACFFELSR